MTSVISQSGMLLRSITLPETPAFPPTAGQKEPYECSVHVTIVHKHSDKFSFVRAYGFDISPEELGSLVRTALTLTITKKDLREVEITPELKQKLPKEALSDEDVVSRLFTKLQAHTAITLALAKAGWTA